MGFWANLNVNHARLIDQSVVATSIDLAEKLKGCCATILPEIGRNTVEPDELKSRFIFI